MLRGKTRRRSSVGPEDRPGADGTFSDEDEDGLPYFDCGEDVSPEEVARLNELRTDIIYVENQLEEMKELIRQEDELAQQEAGKHREKLEQAQERRRSAQADLDEIKQGAEGAVKRRRELAFASLACRMLLRHQTTVECHQAKSVASLRKQRAEIMLKLKNRSLEDCQTRLAQADESHSRVCAELEDLRQGGALWQQQLSTTSAEMAAKAGPLEKELLEQSHLISQRRGSLQVPANGQQQEALKALRAEVSKMQQELKARALERELSARSQCTGTRPHAATVTSAISTSAGTTPRYNSEASASASPSSTPRAAVGKGPSPAGPPAGVRGLPPAMPHGKGKGKGPPLPGGKGGAKAPGSVFAPAVASVAPEAGEPPSPAASPSPPAGKGKGQAPLSPGGKGTPPPGGKGPPPPGGKGLPPPPGGLSKGGPPPGKAGGKGSPPPPGKGGPPPPGMAKAKNGSVKGGMPVLPRSNGLVNVTWKALAEPKASDLSIESDKLLRPILEILESTHSDIIADHKQSTTAFAGAGETLSSVFGLSADQIQDWFKAVAPSSLKTGAAGSDGGTGKNGDGKAAQPKKECLLDEKCCEQVSKLLIKYKMKNSGAGPDFDVVAGLRRAFLSCKAPVDSLEGLHMLVTKEAWEESRSKVMAFVKEKGVAALNLCGPQTEHRLLHAVCDVPNVSDRLQCLIFEAQWPEAQRKCADDLQVLHEGMKVLTAKRDAVKKFFQTALHLGNALNKDSHVPVASRGFKLQSLPKLLQLKSSSKPQYTLLHVALSLIEPAEVKVLVDKLSVLCAAKDRKSYGVHQRCQELLSGLLSIERLSKSVKKQMRKKAPVPAPTAVVAAAVVQTMQQQPAPQSRNIFCVFSEKDQPAPQSQDARHRRRSPGPMREGAYPPPSPTVAVPVEEADPDDVFHERMQQFLDRSRNKARWIAMLCKDIFDTYWELAVFFEDPWAVYPPPSSAKESDTSEDIFALFCKFLQDVVTASKEVARHGLREEIAEAEAKLAGTFVEGAPSAPPAAVVAAVFGKAAPTAPPPSRTTQQRASCPAIPAMSTMSTRSPSPAPQVASNVSQLDATAIRRLREVRSASITRASSRAASASRAAPRERAATERVRQLSPEDDGEQSDVSDWEASPRQKATKATPARSKACPRPSPIASPSAAAASPAAFPLLFTPGAATPDSRRQASPRQKAADLHSACPPRRSVRRPTSSSPGPAARASASATVGICQSPRPAAGSPPNFRDRAYKPVVLPNNSVPTAVAAVSQAIPSAASAVVAPIATAVSVQAAQTTSASTTAPMLGPPPARRCSEAARRSYPDGPSPARSNSVVRRCSKTSVEVPSAVPEECQLASFASMSSLGSMTPRERSCSRGVSPGPEASPAELSMTPPQRPVCVGKTAQLPRRSVARKSLSAHADRLSYAVVSKILGADALSPFESGSSGDDDNEEDFATGDEGSPERPWLYQRRVRSNSRSSSSSRSASPPASTSSGAEQGGNGLGAEEKRTRRKSLSLATEVQAEFRRRSRASRGPGNRTPKGRRASAMADLTPVAEPGETPQTHQSSAEHYTCQGSTQASVGRHVAAGGSPMNAHPISSLRD